MICKSTLEKFRERIQYSIIPEYLHIRVTRTTIRSPIYHYYDFSIKPSNEFEHLRKYIRDENHLRLINRMNQHNRFAAVLGILPNQLIRMITEVKPDDKR